MEDVADAIRSQHIQINKRYLPLEEKATQY